jgi:hypothetical protein
MDFVGLINRTFSFKLGSMDVAPTYWEAVAIVFLLFLLVFTLARVRWLYVHWSMGKGSIAMLVWGFILALIVEGFFWIGGNTLFTKVLGWENAPKPIGTVLDIGRGRLVNVLGTQDEKIEIGPEVTIKSYKLLDTNSAREVERAICLPQ